MQGNTINNSIIMKKMLFQQNSNYGNQRLHSKVIAEQGFNKGFNMALLNVSTYVYKFWWINEGYMHEKHIQVLLHRIIFPWLMTQTNLQTDRQTLKMLNGKKAGTSQKTEPFQRKENRNSTKNLYSQVVYNFSSSMSVKNYTDSKMQFNNKNTQCNWMTLLQIHLCNLIKYLYSCPAVELWNTFTRHTIAHRK